jgi:hypothetical protein
LPINCQVGDHLRFESVVSDPTMLDPFTNVFGIDVKEVAEEKAGGKGSRKPPSETKGEDRENPTGISLPNIVPVHEPDWEKYTPAFDKHTALRIRTTEVATAQAENGNGEVHDVYDFFINMDNISLKTELKVAGDEIELIRARWRYSMVLVGLALLHDEAKKPKKKSEEVREEESGQTIENRVERFTRALAPVILPMIESLGALELDQVLAVTTSGEAV